MKIISIKQPWATLILLEEKRHETRSWQTKHRGELGIHASKTVDKKAFYDPAINQILEKWGITQINQLPIGKILAKCLLVDCFEVDIDLGDSAILNGQEQPLSEQEYCLGDYSLGRFAWRLEGVQLLNEPILVKGKLGLWNYDIESSGK